MVAPSGVLKASKYAAAPALTVPLIPDKLSRRTDSLSSDDFSDVDAEAPSANSGGGILNKSMTRKDIISTIGVGVLATAGMAASLSAIVAFPGAAVILMGGICAINSPTVAAKHLSISKSGGLRTAVSSIRGDIKFLKREVDFVEQAVNDLEIETNQLKSVEEKLQAIAWKQGTNVEELVELVNENESILKIMKANLKETFVAAMAAVVIRSDKDGDMKIDVKELPLLSMRLQINLESYGIKLDTRKFEDMIRENNDISNVLKFCGDVLFEGEEKAIGDDDSAGSDVTFDFESFCNTLDDDDYQTKVTTDERMTMVSLDDRFSKGSVEVARGHRVTLANKSVQKDVRRKTMMKEVKKRQTKVASHKKPKLVKQNVKESRSTRFTLGGLVRISGTSAEV